MIDPLAQLALAAGAADAKAEKEERFHCGAPAVYDAIVAAHAAPEWCVFSEVADATSGRASRRADAVAMNMWASRGLEIRGFEIKVDRSDLKRELQDPSKAEAVGQYCDTWCLAYPAGLVRPDDPIPPAWGLFVVGPKGGRFARLPTTRPREDVKAVSKMFVAAIARAAHAELAAVHKGETWVRRTEIQAKLDAEYQRGIDNAPDGREYQVRDLEAKLKAVQPILDMLGLDEHAQVRDPDTGWRMEAQEALRVGLALKARWGQSAADRASHQLDQAIKDLQEARKAVQALCTEKEDK